MRISSFSPPFQNYSDRVVTPCAHGKTCEQAIHNGEQVIELYLEAWQVEGEPIPAPGVLV